VAGSMLVLSSVLFARFAPEGYRPRHARATFE
jgi:hypothetical protein